MKKHKQIDLMGQMKRELEEKSKPSRQNPKERKQWYRLRDKLERSLSQLREIKDHIKNALKNS